MPAESGGPLLNCCKDRKTVSCPSVIKRVVSIEGNRQSQAWRLRDYRHIQNGTMQSRSATGELQPEYLIASSCKLPQSTIADRQDTRGECNMEETCPIWCKKIPYIANGSSEKPRRLGPKHSLTWTLAPVGPESQPYLNAGPGSEGSC